MSFFSEKLRFKYSCKAACTKELLLQQALDNSITKELVNVAGIKELEEMLNAISYPYEKSFEIKTYFDEVFKKSENMKYEDYVPDINTINDLLFSDNPNTNIMDLTNAIDLFNYNITGDLYSAYKKFKFSSKNQVAFMTSYLMEYLPEIFVYRAIKGFTDHKVTSVSIAFANLLAVSDKKGIAKLEKNIKEVTLSFWFSKVEIDASLCTNTMKVVIQDSAKINQICSNTKLDMKTYESIKAWILPQACLDYSCRKDEIDFILNESKLKLEDFVKVYSKDTPFGKALNNMNEQFNAHYHCNTEDCSAATLAKRQLRQSFITRNIPEKIKSFESDSISSWDKIEYETPLEYSYIITKLQCTQCNLNLEDFLNNKEILEEAFTLVKNNIDKAEQYNTLHINLDPVNQVKVLRSFITANAFNNAVIVSHNLDDILNGINNSSLDALRSGNDYDNFKPYITKTTGFNMNADPGRVDRYTLSTGRNSDIRVMSKLNGLKLYNTFEEIYDSKQKANVNKQVMLYNQIPIQSMSDGFEYSTDKSTIYFYDSFTSRVLKFNYDSFNNENGPCYKYILDENDFAQGLYEDWLKLVKPLGTVFRKFNKPYLTSTYKTIKKIAEIKQSKLDENENNFICVEPFSNYVLLSNIRLVVT
jgi:hypothetical protein